MTRRAMLEDIVFLGEEIEKTRVDIKRVLLEEVDLKLACKLCLHYRWLKKQRDRLKWRYIVGVVRLIKEEVKNA